MASPATVQRAILRAIQRDPNITRSRLSIQIRPYDANWDALLEGLIQKGLVIRATEIRRPGEGWTVQRSYVVYTLAAGDHPAFDAMEPRDVTRYIEVWSPQSAEV